MIRPNPKNEIIKREYRDWLQHADGKSEATIRQIEKAVNRFEQSTGRKDFGSFDQRQAVTFKNQLAAATIAKATILSTATAVKRFFGWLSIKPGYRSKINRFDIDYFSLSEKDVRAAKAPAEKAFPTLEQIRHVIDIMQTATPVQRRNRALISLMALTGIRDGALITLKLKHVDIENRKIIQDPREVATKFGKRIDTFFPPIDHAIEDIVCEWVKYLETDLLFGPADPLFPRTALERDQDDCFVGINLSREHWANAQPVRDITKAAFSIAGVPYFPPHRFRNMLVQQAYRFCKTPEQLKAWSQNFGHESALTTLMSYGKLDLYRQGQLIRGATCQSSSGDDPVTKGDLELLLRNFKS